MKIQDNFVSFELAKRLKELGFDEKCLAGWNIIENHPLEQFNKPYLTLPRNKTGDIKTYKTNDYVLKAPLYQQVLNWLEDEHKLCVNYAPHEKDHYLYQVFKLLEKGLEELTDISHAATRKEALESCINQALNLIENDNNRS